eukprot:750742-Hanusia_phi.AAC.3
MTSNLGSRSLVDADHGLASLVHSEAEGSAGAVPLVVVDVVLHRLEARLAVSEDALVDPALSVVQLGPDAGTSEAVHVTKGSGHGAGTEVALLGRVSDGGKGSSRSGNNRGGNSLDHGATVHLHGHIARSGPESLRPS